MRLASILFIILFIGVNCFSQEKQFSFADGSKLAINPDYAIKYVNSIFTGKFLEKEIVFTFKGFGKSLVSSPFGEFLNKSDVQYLKKLTKKQTKSLFRQIDKINTAYDLEQDATKFYVNGLNSINVAKLSDLKDCPVKVKVVIIELKANNVNYYLPIIKSIIALNSTSSPKC